MGQAVANTLWKRRRETIAVVTAELREEHRAVREVVGNFSLSLDNVHLTSLNVNDVVAQWQSDSDDGLLFGQRHLFRTLEDKEQELLIEQ